MATEYPDDHFQLVLSLAANRHIQDLSIYPPEYARQIEQHPRFTELMRRVAYKLQAFHLMECVAAPLAGCP